MISLQVYNMTYGTSHPRPYVLFGPPGTGKTSTVVEAIKQVWATDERSRILVAAPSNTAADLLASKLLEDVPKEDILRLVSFRWLDQMKKKGLKAAQEFRSSTQNFVSGQNPKAKHDLSVIKLLS